MARVRKQSGAGVAVNGSTNGSPSTNGTPNHSRINDTLIGEPLTTGYKPTLPLDQMYSQDGLPLFFIRRDIEAMLIHPIVRSALNYYRSGISGAEFEVKCENAEIGKFIEEQCKRYWDRGVPYLQAGDEYGWIACECNYTREDDGDGPLKWDSVSQFSPRDSFLLTQGHIPVGVRIKNVIDKGQVDLWMADGDVPAKGLWYAHNPRYSLFYGQSQLTGAWRPWRRAATKDAAETVLDGGVYRCAYQGPQVGYPQEDMQSQPGVPNTTLNSQGNPIRFARDIARQIAEQAKAGAAIGLPTTPYPKEVGSGQKWTLTWPTSAFNCDPILNYIKNLYDQINFGIGVPPELLMASETGSGYSGRRIPMEAFLEGQQRIADALLQLFLDQVMKPLVLWNWGQVRWEAKVKRLLETKNKAAGGQPGDGQGQPGQNGQQPPNAANPMNQGAGNGQPKTPAFQPTGAQMAIGTNGMNLLITDRIREIARRALSGRIAA